ncbi:MAG: DUF721 domain-containing protein [Gemmatimonadaceae bacterium]
MTRKKGAPVPMSDAVSGFLARRGLKKRVEQAESIADWPLLVGDSIAAVTWPISVTQDGTLFVAVNNHGWMTELSLLEPELLGALNGVEGRVPIRKIRFLLRR